MNETAGGTDKILWRTEGPVAWLTFNNPEKRNALALEMSARAAELIKSFDEDESLRVLVLSGAGGKSFVSGADISEFEKRRMDAKTTEGYEQSSMRMYGNLAAVKKPTIAMIQGFCMGGGFALAAFCDLRIATENSVFAIPAARLGIGYRVDFTKRVMDLVGPANTKEILFTARRYNASEAASMGFLNRVVPDGEIESFTKDYVAGIANNAPLSIRATKIIVEELLRDESARDIAACDAATAACADSEDFKNARRAFMEKRPVTFQGK